MQYTPELLRLKGRVLEDRLAEICYRDSLDLSRRQGARGRELRTATDLAVLWAGQGRSRDGRALLQPVFERFTEGRETADLQAAERLLATLS